MNTPAIYASFYPGLKQLAETYGYALTIHGSLNRDFDLVAIPWITAAADAETLVEAIKSRLGGYFNPADTLPVIRPHGRRCWPIWLDGEIYIDLAVMPLAKEELMMDMLIGDEEATLIARIRDDFKPDEARATRCIDSGAMSRPEWAAEWIISEIEMLEVQQDKMLDGLNRIANFDCTGMTNGNCGYCPSCIANKVLEDLKCKSNVKHACVSSV